MSSTLSLCFFLRGSAWGLNWEFDSSTISTRFIAVELRISKRTSLGFTSITLGILGRISSIAKEELGFWSYGDVVVPIGLTFNFGDLSQTLFSGDFGPLQRNYTTLGTYYNKIQDTMAW